jgi:peptidyl-prolyl cis-trans isomerase C
MVTRIARNVFQPRLLSLGAALVLCFLGCTGDAENGRGDAEDLIVIEMKGGDVRLSKIRSEYDRVKGQGAFENSTFPERLEFAETYANKECLLREAKRHVKSPSRVTEVQLARYRERFLENAFWREVSPEEIVIPPDTLESYRSNFRRQMLLNVIRVPTEDQARDLISRIEAGESFEALARRHSTEPYTKDSGGRTDWVGRDATVLQLVARYASENLEKGQMSREPVETPLGFHVVRVEDVRDLESTPEREETWARLGRQAYLRNRSRAVRDSMVAYHRLEIKEETLEPLTWIVESFWDSLRALGRKGGFADHMKLDPPEMTPAWRDDWSSVLLTFDDSEWTIDDFMESLKLCDVEFWPRGGGGASLTGREVKKRMERKFMVDSAIEWGWEKTPWFAGRMDWQKDRRVVRDYYDGVLAQEVAVTEEDIRARHEASPGDFLENDSVDFGVLLYPPNMEQKAHEALKLLKAGQKWEDVGTSQTLANPAVRGCPSVPTANPFGSMQGGASSGSRPGSPEPRCRGER